MPDQGYGIDVGDVLGGSVPTTQQPNTQISLPYFGQQSQGPPALQMPNYAQQQLAQSQAKQKSWWNNMMQGLAARNQGGAAPGNDVASVMRGLVKLFGGSNTPGQNTNNQVPGEQIGTMDQSVGTEG